VATLKLGATTPSFDEETEEDSRSDARKITRELFDATLQKFRGETEQVPPIFSAVKVKGKRAFNYARSGENLKLQPKKIVIQEIVTEEFEPPFATIRVACSKGTYIRALARDIGIDLDCGAYLTGLRRTRIGEFDVKQAITVDYFLENIDSYVTN